MDDPDPETEVNASVHDSTNMNICVDIKKHINSKREDNHKLGDIIRLILWQKSNEIKEVLKYVDSVNNLDQIFDETEKTFKGSGGKSRYFK